MTTSRRPLIAGNWKMNGLAASMAQLGGMIAGVDSVVPRIDLMIFPPATLVAAFASRARGSRIGIGGQDCHVQADGPFTGDLSAEMLADAGAQAVIVGHSERRVGHCETCAVVQAKVLAAWRAGLMAIVCIGETQAERAAGSTLDIIGRQIAQSLPYKAPARDLTIAYEPIWAIGSGLTPTLEEIAQVHQSIRASVVARFGGEGENMRLLYGGSVKAANAAAILHLENVDGALIGGASLAARDFLAIAATYR
ncbi:MAG: triose-phosphate isomerase [Proteobacteria bacterium]|nr:triose-phosphate isomerase [Pseudomonadota bacterium]